MEENIPMVNQWTSGGVATILEPLIPIETVLSCERSVYDRARFKVLTIAAFIRLFKKDNRKAVLLGLLRLELPYDENLGIVKLVEDLVAYVGPLVEAVSEAFESIDPSELPEFTDLNHKFSKVQRNILLDWIIDKHMSLPEGK